MVGRLSAGSGRKESRQRVLPVRTYNRAGSQPDRQLQRRQAGG